MSAPTIDRRLQSPPTRVARTRAAAAGAAAAIAAIAIGVRVALAEPWWVESALVAALAVCTVAAVVDTVSRRIPDRLVLASLVPVAIGLVLLGVAGDARVALLTVPAGAVLFALPLAVVHLIVPSAMGFGDVKLALALGAALGLVEWRLAIVALCLASGLTVAVAIARRRPTMPFAPGLVVGAALALVLPTLEGPLPWR